MLSGLGKQGGLGCLACAILGPGMASKEVGPEVAEALVSWSDWLSVQPYYGRTGTDGDAGSREAGRG